MHKLNLVTAGLLSVALIGCSDSKHEKGSGGFANKTVSPGAIAEKQNLSPSGKAEELAAAGEELFTGNPLAFTYADKIMDQALAMDSGNKKAQFYKKLIANFTVFEGIFKRVQPLSEHDEELRKGYLEGIEKMKEEVPERVYAFLMNGQPDIANEKDVQKLMEDINQRRDDMRKFLKNNKDMGIALYAPMTWAVGLNGRARLCDFHELPNGDIQYTECTSKQKTQLQMGPADVEALQNIFAVQQIYGILMNSYDTTGAIDVAKEEQKRKDNNLPSLTGKEQYEIASLQQDFGLLRSKSQLQKIREMGVDGLKAARMVLADQKKYCPDSDHTKYWDNSGRDFKLPEGGDPWEYIDQTEIPRRPGMMFEDGFCINERRSNGDLMTDVFNKVENGLFGAVRAHQYWDQRDWSQKAIVVKDAAIIDTPVEDLKTLKPQFNDCDDIVSLADDTVGGIFPSGGHNEYLKSQQSWNCLMNQQANSVDR